MKDEIKEILEALKPLDEEFAKAGIKEYPLYLKPDQQKDKNIIKANENEKKYYNLTLERRPHFCNDIQDELDLNKKEKDLNKIQIDENIIKDDIDEIKKDENNGENDTIKFIKNSMTTENFLNISKMIEEKIGDDIFLPDNDEEK